MAPRPLHGINSPLKFLNIRFLYKGKMYNLERRLYDPKAIGCLKSAYKASTLSLPSLVQRVPSMKRDSFIAWNLKQYCFQAAM